MRSAIGQPISRVDGPAKVRGQARYAGEFQPHGLVHAVLVTSTIVQGRIIAIDDSEALRVPGVMAVISHLNAPRLPWHIPEQRPVVDPKAGEPLHLFQGPEVHFNGQPVALVIAGTLEGATEAAARVQVSYAPANGVTMFDEASARPPHPDTASAGRPGTTSRGDADAALAQAAVRIDATYRQPREHHNAIEPHVTIAAWDGDHLTLYDKTQWVDNDRQEVAHALGISESQIRVISPFVGGAFGSALRTWPHVIAAAIAAREVRRPVRLELTRRQLYSGIGFRPRTEQRIALGADRDGRLQAVVHEATAQTARYEEYAETTVNTTTKAYACRNVRTAYRLADMNINSPCPMRAPGTVTGIFALETAMDELAVALNMDPLELRLRNFADHDQHQQHPWSSNELQACYRAAAEKFGWHRRPQQPGTLRHDGKQVGYGMAMTMYPANREAASASVSVFANGTALIRSAASDMGPGTYTSMTQVAAECLGLPVDKIGFELGDTDLPVAPVHGGSITMASVGNAVMAACRSVESRLIDLARAPGSGPFAGVKLADLVCRDGAVMRASGAVGEAVPYGELLRRCGLSKLDSESHAEPGEEEEQFSSSAFGAVFAEVHVDAGLGTIRVPRLVGAYDIGRVVNPKIARSQCIGGMVGGIGMALLEAAEWDARFGRVMNSNLAEYLVPVCADVGELDVTFVASDDRNFNPLGVKGVAEIAICGVAPAIGNAIYNATGRRLRDLPFTPARLLAG